MVVRFFNRFRVYHWDRNGSFRLRLIKKGQRNFDGFDDKIISMYALGMTVQEIQGDLKDMYGVKVSPDLLRRVTEGVMQEVKEGQNRPHVSTVF